MNKNWKQLYHLSLSRSFKMVWLFGSSITIIYSLFIQGQSCRRVSLLHFLLKPQLVLSISWLVVGTNNFEKLCIWEKRIYSSGMGTDLFPVKLSIIEKIINAINMMLISFNAKHSELYVSGVVKEFLRLLQELVLICKGMHLVKI